MPRLVFLFDPPVRFVVGTVGQPGERTFFLQARGSGQLTSVALEKLQVTALAERLEALLDEVVRRTGGEAPVPAIAPSAVDDAPLEQPILEEFRAGTLALAWDGEREQVVVEAHAVTEDSETDLTELSDEDEGPPVLRVRMSGGMARAFARRALRIASAGRPPCPLCGQPLDDAHVCPRQNGHHTPA